MAAPGTFWLVVALTVVVGESVYGYVNDYDKQALIDCNGNQYLSYLHSIHSNRHEDRRWGYNCRNAGRTLTNCQWSGYVNDFDGLLSYICPGNKVVTGMTSYHDNHREDRRFKFKCCTIPGKTTKSCFTTGYVNNWDKPMAVRVPDGKVIKGAFSAHDNHREDRRWRFRICSI